MFKKIIVIGSPGAGKSTFSRRLQEITGLPLYHLDMIKHKPDKTEISKDEFDARLNEIIAKDQWIIDGNYQRTIEVRLKSCDTVFLLDYPLDVCLSGARERVGKKCPDMPWVETEFDPEFKQWIIDFPKEALPHIYELLDTYRDRDITILKSRGEAEECLAALENRAVKKSELC